MNDPRSLITSNIEEASFPSEKELVAFTATVFGAASGGFQGLMLTSGRLVQALWTGRLWPQLLREVKEWHDKGKIKPDYFATNQNWENLTEILDYLDNGVPNTEVWKLLRSIYFVSATEKLSTRADILPQQYTRLAKSLNSTEALTLMALFSLYESRSKPLPRTDGSPPWSLAEEAARISGLEYSDLAFQSLHSLSGKCLVQRMKYPESRGSCRFTDNNFCGLTQLGLNFCGYVRAYDKECGEL